MKTLPQHRRSFIPVVELADGDFIPPTTLSSTLELDRTRSSRLWIQAPIIVIASSSNAAFGGGGGGHHRPISAIICVAHQIHCRPKGKQISQIYLDSSLL
jgi:hypothetical protein